MVVITSGRRPRGICIWVSKGLWRQSELQIKELESTQRTLGLIEREDRVAAETLAELDALRASLRSRNGRCGCCLQPTDWVFLPAKPSMNSRRTFLQWSVMSRLWWSSRHESIAPPCILEVEGNWFQASLTYRVCCLPIAVYPIDTGGPQTSGVDMTVSSTVATQALSDLRRSLLRERAKASPRRPMIQWQACFEISPSHGPMSVKA